MAQILIYGKVVTDENTPLKGLTVTVFSEGGAEQLGSDITLYNGDFNLAIPSSEDQMVLIEISGNPELDPEAFDSYSSSDLLDPANRVQFQVDGSLALDGGSFMYIAYADTEDGTGFSLTPRSSSDYVQIITTDTPLTPPKPDDFQDEWLRIKGTDGTDGSNGDDAYLHIRFSASSTGSPMQSTPDSNTRFIGTLSNNSSSAPTNPDLYSWTRIAYDPPQAGSDGQDGTSFYVHIRYATDIDGVGMAALPSPSRPYIGIYSGTSASAPAGAGNYEWSKYIGDDGADGQDGVDGAEGPSGMNGINGLDGANAYVHIKYATASDGAGMSATPSASRPFIGIYSGPSASAPNDAGSYSWSKYIGEDGANGNDGTDGINGRGITDIELQGSTTLLISYTDSSRQEIELASLIMGLPKEYIVEGIVADTDGLPLNDRYVRVFHKQPDAITQLGVEARTTASGEYKITFNEDDLTENSIESPDLIVRVYASSSDSDTSQQITSPLIVDAPLKNYVNLAIGSGTLKNLIRYNFIKGRIDPFVGDGEVDSFMTASAVADLAQKTKSTTELVMAFLQAKKNSVALNLSEEMFFGLAQSGRYPSLAHMMTAENSAMKNALLEAIEIGAIDSRITESSIDTFIDDLKKEGPALIFNSELGDNVAMEDFLSSISFTGNQKTAFAEAWLKADGDITAMWNTLNADTETFPEGTADAETITELTGFAGDSKAAKAFFAGGNTVKDIAAMEKTAVETILSGAEINWDDRFPGSSDDEKLSNFADTLLARAEREFPTSAFMGSMTRDGDFESSNFEQLFNPDEVNSSFTFEGESLAEHLEANSGELDFISDPEERESFRQDLEGMQRLFRVVPETGKYSNVIPLFNGGLKSAGQIHRMGETAFIKRYGDGETGIGQDNAKSVFREAAARSGATLHLMSNFSPRFMEALPQVIRNHSMFGDNDSIPGFPNLEDLFGAQDFCACQHCRSVYSAAAYLVDLLHWLSEVEVSNVTNIDNLKLALDARRPEIENILLTCDNTNIPLPYVDLVNEVLENAIDETSASLITSTPNPIRQTSLDSSFLRAHPEHVRADVYDELRTKVYPWTAPFDLFESESKVYLKHLGVVASRLLKIFDTSLSAGDYACKDLGLNPLEKAIIVADSTAINTLAGATVGFADFFGNETVGNMQASVRLFMEQTGLTYNETEDYHQSYFINPLNVDGERTFWLTMNGATCDPDTATMNLNAAGMIRLMRFHKLRTHLDWTIEELDRAIFTLPGNNDIDDDKLARISGVKKLAQRFRLDIDEVLSWYGDLSDLTYFEKPSYFMEQFVNPSVNNAGESFTIVEPILNGSAGTQSHTLEVLFTQGNSTDNYSLLHPTILPLALAGTRLTDTETSLLFPDPISPYPGALLTNQNLSYMYRVNLFCNSAEITVAEYQDYIALFGMDPILPVGTALGTPDPEQTERFLELLAATRALNLNAEAIHYLVNDDTTADVALDVTTWITTLETLQFDLRDAQTQLHIETDNARETAIQYLNLFLGLDQANAGLIWTKEDLDELVAIFDGVSIRERLTAGTPTGESQQELVESLMTEVLTNGQIETLIDAIIDDDDSYAHTNEDFIGNENLEDRYEKAFGADASILQAAVENLIWPLIRERIITQTFATYFEADNALVNDLVKARLEHFDGSALSGNSFLSAYTDPAFSAFTDPANPDTPDLDVSDDTGTAPTNLDIYSANGRLLHKSLMLTASLKAGINDLDYLFQTGLSNATGLPNFKNLFGSMSGNIAEFSALWLIGREHRKSASLGSLFQLLYSANDFSGGVQDVFTGLENLFGWREVAETCGAEVLNLVEADYDDTAWYFDVKAISLANASSMIKPRQLKVWVKNESTASISQSLANACKSKHGEAQWNKVAPDLRDVIRIEQRDALADYMIYHETSYNFEDRYALYEHFLIDTEMEPCMMTTRIVQATNSIQLFVMRLMMNLEHPEYQLDRANVKEWEWRRNYRVWEANRKVFLYPENWLEPELRDNKTNFFKEMEEELLQQDLTMEAATDAYLKYLEQLDDVADLEVMQIFKDLETNILYVFARTKSAPHLYYYRKWVSDAWWTHWERIEMDIEGDHLVPVVYNDRLMLFWPSIRIEGDEPESGFDNPKEARLFRKFIVNINWTELKNGKWTKRKRSKDSMEMPKTSTSFGPEDLFFKASIDNLNVLRIEVARLTGSTKYLYKLTEKGEFAFESINKEPKVTQTGDNATVYDIGLKPNHYQHFYPDALPFVVTAFNGSDIEIAAMDDHNDSTHPASPRCIPYTLLRDRVAGQPWLVVSHQIPIKSREVFGNIPFFYYDKDRTMFVRPIVRKEPIYASVRAFLSDVTYRSVADTSFLVIGGNSRSTGGSEFATDTAFYGESASDTAIMDDSFVRGQSDSVTIGDWQIVGYTNEYTYQFHAFDHRYVGLIARQVNRWGVEGLLRPIPGRTPQDDQLDRQQVAIEYFQSNYDPTSNVVQPYPKDDIDFSVGGGYSIYNWELFFHAPLLVASELTKNQRFEEAQKWFHFIFDPTQVQSNLATEQGVKRFWRTKPFHNFSGEASIDMLMQMLNDGDQEMEKQVTVWRANPFMPHAIARLRHVAYMKNVVMKYLDMLIAWGDMLFTRDTMESVNEAIQVYLLAAQILGRRPEVITRKGVVQPESYANSLGDSLDAFSNAAVSIENQLPATYSFSETNGGGENGDNQVTTVEVLYFCIPKNEKLWGYWDLVADRLFKIRHCMNIEGVVRALPIFAPPIDPGMLVKAAASGLSIGAALSDMSAPMPFYKYTYLYQKAMELCNDVKALGGALQAALEKKDAEALSLLRNTQEVKVLEVTTDMKEKAIEEAGQNITALKETRRITEERMNFYKSRKYMIAREEKQIEQLNDAKKKRATTATIDMIAAILAIVPQFDIGVSGISSPVVKGEFGGAHLSDALKVASMAIGREAAQVSERATVTGIQAGYDRREEDWKFQADQAKAELKKIDQDILAAEIRKAMAEADLNTHSIQIENAKEIGSFMEDKWSNEDLYKWLSSEISKIYFKAYQMAYDMSKKAEKAYHYQVGFEDTTQYVNFGHWDSLYKGLLAGERLHQDLKRLDIAHTDKNKREIELSKKVSLAMINPEALQQLRITGSCDFNLTEMLYDLDHPGHYMRRIKAVTVSVPCVTGPYVGVTGKLSLLSNRMRVKSVVSGSYEETTGASGDASFVYNLTGIQSISTSRGQDDSGMFELNFQDARYLPFEGAGAISSWRFELPFRYDKNNYDRQTLRQFDYHTISDLIVTVHYTARDGGSLLKAAAEANLTANLEKWLLTGVDTGLTRVFSMKHEFPTQLHQFLHPASDSVDHVTEFDISDRHFPHILKGIAKVTSNVQMIIKLKDSFGNITALPDTAFELANANTGFTAGTTVVNSTSNPSPLPDRIVSQEFTASDEDAVSTWTLTGKTGAGAGQLGQIASNPSILTATDQLKPEAIDDIIFVMNYKRD